MKKLNLIIVFFLFTLISVIGQNVSKNSLAIELGYGGGDGIFPTYIYGANYTREFNGRLSGYAKYNLTSGADIRTRLDEKYIDKENMAESPNTRFGQFVFVGVGMELKVVKTDKSFLYIITGLRYVKSKISRTTSTFNDEDERVTSASSFQRKGVGYEFGFGYKRRFAENYFVGGGIGFTNVESRISASFMIGVNF